MVTREHMITTSNQTSTDMPFRFLEVFRNLQKKIYKIFSYPDNCQYEAIATVSIQLAGSPKGPLNKIKQAV